MNIINSTPRHASKCISAMERAMKLEQNQNVALKHMKAATMVLNMLDDAIYIYQVSSKALTCHSILLSLLFIYSW